jgi:hypothetical protein
MHPSLAYDLADFRALKYYMVDVKAGAMAQYCLRAEQDEIDV